MSAAVTKRLHFRQSVCALVAAICATIASNFALAQGEWRFSDVDRVVAVADIHGAYDAFETILKGAALVDDSLNWIGGPLGGYDTSLFTEAIRDEETGELTYPGWDAIVQQPGIENIVNFPAALADNLGIDFRGGNEFQVPASVGTLLQAEDALDAELAELAETPICNLILLVHGHNEEEKGGLVVRPRAPAR